MDRREGAPKPPPETASFSTLDAWNREGYSLRTYGSGDFSVVMLGEAHRISEHEEKQIELIRLIKPEYVLHEFAKGWLYNPETKRFERQPQRAFDENDFIAHEEPECVDPIAEELPKLRQLADELGFQIVGCDLTQAEFQQAEQDLANKFPGQYTMDSFLGQKALRNKRNPRYVFTPQSKEMVPYRDARIAKTILEYQLKSSKPIIAIMGAHHGENIHRQKMLQRKGFGYVFVNQIEKMEKR